MLNVSDVIVLSIYSYFNYVIMLNEHHIGLRLEDGETFSLTKDVGL